MLKNSITLKLFDRGAALTGHTSRLASRARGIRFGSIFPGGYSAISFFIPCEISTPLEITEGCKVIAFNWTVEVWHGFIASIAYTLGSNGETGVQVIGVGSFGYVFASRRIDKRWADNRMTSQVWSEPESAFSGNDQSLSQIEVIDRLPGRIRFTPKNVAFTNQWYGRVVYSMPIGETVKRVKLSYGMAESAQSWELTLWNSFAGVAVWTVSATGTGTRDDTLATPSREIFFLFRSAAGQTPAADGSIYGQVDDAVSGANAFMVYSETGNINALEVAKDLVAIDSRISSNTDRISSALTAAVEPFFTTGKEALASILQRVCSYGDTSYQPIGYAIWGSQETGDEKPQLVVESYPSLSSFDYVIDAADPRLEAPINIVRDASSVVNYVSVRWTQPNGVQNMVTPDDDANLSDASSIALYGRREPDADLDIGYGSYALAVRAGRAYIADKKYPRPYVSGPIKLYESIRNQDGGETPVSEIRAGQRVKLVNVADDVLGIDSAGATFVLTEHEYDDDTQSASLVCGIPDSLASFLAAGALIPKDPILEGMA